MNTTTWATSFSCVVPAIVVATVGGEEPALPRRGEPITAECDGDRLARQIAARRQRLRLSQKQLAARARISRGYLILVERGADAPSPAVLARIGRALRCSSAELSCVPAGR